MKREVIRVGDQVQILVNRFVKRVGYPLVWHEITDEIEDAGRTRLAYRLLQGKGPIDPKELQAQPCDGGLGSLRAKSDYLPPYFVQAAAKVRVETEGFGGNRRSLHYWPEPAEGEMWVSGKCGPRLEGMVCLVGRKRVVKTGIRFPSSGGVDHNGEYWEEQGGLDDEKTHILLDVGGWEIEQRNVKLIKRGTPK